MAPILDLLRRVFAPLVYRSDGGARRSELRAILARLKSWKPPVFRPRGGVVLAGFAQAALELHRVLEPLRLIFDHSILHEDPLRAERFRDWLVEARLPAELDVRSFSFTYKEMKRAITPGTSVELALKQAEGSFQRYIASLEGEAYEGFDAAMNETMRLASLARFDFGRLLRRFDPRFEALQREYRPLFGEVPGEELVDELLDLYFLIGRLSVTEGVVRNLVYLGSRLYRAEHFDPEGIARSAHRVKEVLRRTLPPQLLLDLIRAIREDPFYVAKVDESFEEYLAGFRRRVTEQYAAARDRLVSEARRAALDEDVKALFEGGELLPLVGYNEEESALLLRGGLEGYHLVFPLRVLKSFAVAHYEARLAEPVRMLLVEGAFRDRAFQESISTAAEECNSVRLAIEQFEGAFRDGGRFSARVVHRALDAHEHGKAAASAALQSMVREANREARAVLEKGSGSYYRLGVLLRDVLADYRVRIPDRVVNVRVIGGERNRAFISALVEGYTSIRRFLQIVKQYAIVHARVAPGDLGPAGPEEAAEAEDS